MKEISALGEHMFVNARWLAWRMADTHTKMIIDHSTDNENPAPLVPYSAVTLVLDYHAPTRHQQTKESI
jgi:hypothetical protein